MTRPEMTDILVAVGFALVVTGVWMWSTPAALVLLGVGLIVTGLVGDVSR